MPDSARAVRVDVLGGVRAFRDDEPLRLGGAQVRALIAALVLADGQAVTYDQLVDAIWDGSPPRAVRQALHSYVAKLRTELEPDRAARAAATVLVSSPTGYSLALADDAVDAWRFAASARAGTRALRDGRLAEALSALDTALAEWGEPPYGDLSERAFLAADVARLRELWITAREEHAEAALGLGVDATLHAELDRLTREYPLRERTWELRARALARDGRQADALAVLRTARTVLREELGIDPGPGLQRLEQDALDGRLTDTPDATPRTTDAAPRTTDTPRRESPHLPAPLTPLLGRADELADLRDALAAHRLVTLVGPGGVGKTRLALAAARDEADGDWSAGPWFVELADLTSPSLLAVTAAGALGAAGAQRTEDLALFLREAKALIVLDNCEHLLDAVAEFVAAVLPQCPGVTILATSREPLGVPGERLAELGPLAGEAAAVELFVTRAQALIPRWRPTPDEEQQIAAICAELDGLPLAIELAAARSRTLSVDEIAASLHDRFALLVGGARTGPERLRSLEASVSLSVEDLPDRHRRLFATLSVFAGGFDLAAVRAVADGAGADDVETLLGKSLLTADPTARPRRFGMLESLREYGTRLLRDTEQAAVRARHRAWVVEACEEADRHWLGRDAVRWFARVRLEQANVRAAFESAIADGDATTALRLAGALGWYWYRFGHITEGIGWSSAALQLVGDGPHPRRASAFIAMAPLQYLAGAHDAAAKAIGAALAEGDPATMTTKYVRARAFQAYLSAADPAAASAIAQQALDEARQWGDGPGEAEALAALGQIARLSGAPDRAATLLEQSIAVARKSEHGFAVASAGWMLVKVRLDRGEAERAVRSAVALSRFLESEPDVTSWLVALHTLAGALGMAGEAAAGARLLGAVSALGSDIGFQPQQMDPLDSERNVRLVRSSLSSQAFAEEFRIGMLGRRDVVEAVLESATAAPDPMFDRSGRRTA
ncbi:AfsR/SARP family transcriptional regulator [Cryptosporangium aurantiacum]|uniref:Predicted ATPase n=1 Tax=Cryptosporangium aurantiacum TaxID=134849 RepID=A0A1M7TZ24_9ACTN|nr:BTAD domain-containing putative transcriptional regulator [Cryptosporangium aurantiacum]SHN75913.1 Predicted ATPase [Cryptosporangium aurantiacum]